MKILYSVQSVFLQIRAGSALLWKENRNVIIQFFVALSFFAVGIWFLHQQKEELVDVKNVKCIINFPTGMGHSRNPGHVCLHSVTGPDVCIFVFGNK